MSLLSQYRMIRITSRKDLEPLNRGRAKTATIHHGARSQPDQGQSHLETQISSSKLVPSPDIPN